MRAPMRSSQRAEVAGRRRFQLGRLVRRQRPGAAAEQTGVGFRRPALLFAGHGVAAQKLAAGDVLPRQVDDFALGAAGVGDQGVGADQRIEMPDGVENAADGLGEEDQIGLGHGFGQRRAAVDGARGQGVGDGARRN